MPSVRCASWLFCASLLAACEPSAPVDGGPPPTADAGPLEGADAGPAQNADAGVEPTVDGGPPPDAGPPARTYVCTEIHGAAQSRAWFIDGIFEGYVGAGTWQRLGGTGINHWRRADNPVWDESIENPCTTASDAPDRVVQVLWGHTTFDVDEWERNIREAYDVARLRRPSMVTFVVMAAAGLEGCAGSYAAEQNGRIEQAIARVVGPDIEAGPVVELMSCDQIDRPSLDRLTPEGARFVAHANGAFFGD